MLTSQRLFWARFVATAFVVNGPLAYAVAAGALSLTVGFALSAILGVALLVIWDSSRTPAAAPAARVDAEVRQTDGARPAERTV